MELIVVLRRLRRRWFFVVPGVVLAIAAGMQLAAREPARSGVAWVRLLLDTRPSQLVASAPAGADTLGWRATLMAGLMERDVSRSRVAGVAGVPLQTLTVNVPALDAPAKPTSLAVQATEAAVVAGAPHVVTLAVDEGIATILVRADSVDEAAATRLVEAAASVLAELTPSLPDKIAPGTLRPGEIADQRYVMERVGPVRSEEVVGRDSRALAGVTALILFVAWCTGVVLLPSRSRSRKRPRAARVVRA